MLRFGRIKYIYKNHSLLLCKNTSKYAPSGSKNRRHLYINWGILILMDKNNKKNQNILYWIPRISAVFLTIFSCVFTIFILSIQYPFFQPERSKPAFLILTIIFTINLVVSWKWEETGGIFYLILGGFLYYFFPLLWLDSVLNPFYFCSIPAGLIGILFLFHYNNFEKKPLELIFCPFCGLKMPKPDKFTSCIVCYKDLTFLN